MSLSMIGTVTLRNFNKQQVGTKGISVTGTVAFQVPYSATIQTFPFKVVEYSEKNAEFMSKYFFTEQGKQALAKGNLAFEDGTGWLYLIKELEFTSFKDSGAVSTNYAPAKTTQAAYTNTAPPIKEAPVNDAYKAAAAEQEQPKETGDYNKGTQGNYWQNLKKKNSGQ